MNGRLVLVARAQWMKPEARGGAAAGTEWRPQPDQSNPIFLLRVAPLCSGALTALVATPAAPHSWPRLQDLVVQKFLSPFFPPQKLDFKGSDGVRELMNGADGTAVVSPEMEMLTYLRSVARPSRAQHFERNYIRRNCQEKKKKSLFPSALWKSGDSSEPCAH